MLVLAGVVAVVGIADGQASTPWSGFQGRPDHLGTALGAGPEPALRLRAITSRPSDQGRSSGAVQAGGLWITVSRTRFTAFEAATGRTRWSVPRDRGTVLTPAVDAATGDVVATEGTVKRGAALVDLDAATGAERWHIPLPAPATSPVTVAAGVAYLAIRDHRLYAADLSSRTSRRLLAFDGVGDAAPAVDGGRVFVTTRATAAVRSTLYAVSASSGRLVWTVRVQGTAPLASAPAASRGTVYAVFGDGTARAFDQASGRERWSAPLRETATPESAPAVARGSIYANDALGGLYALDARTGARRWDFQFRSTSLWSAPLVTRTAVYLGLDDGTIGAVSRADGHLVWETRLRLGAVGPLAGGGGSLLSPLLGRRGGVAVFVHDSSTPLIDRVSPSVLDLPRGLAAYALAALAVFAGLLVLFRFLLDPSRRRPYNMRASRRREEPA